MMEHGDTPPIPSSLAPGAARDWDPDASLASLQADMSTMDDGDARRAADRIFTDGAPGAAARLVHLAMYAEDDRVATNAAKYVCDRVLGPPGSPHTGRDGLLADLEALLLGTAPNVDAGATTSGGGGEGFEVVD
jgi:hypothetical protein